MESISDLENLNSSNLSATTIKVRDSVIQKCEGKNLHEMTQFIKGLLSHEENDQKRLGVLAARVYMLREKITFMKSNDDEADDSADNIKDRHTNVMEARQMEKDADAEPVADEAGEAEPSNWIRVRITENAEVNNVRFPAGVVIDAFNEDAQRLIASGKAEVIDKDDDDSGLDDLNDEAEAATADADAADDDDDA